MWTFLLLIFLYNVLDKYIILFFFISGNNKYNNIISLLLFVNNCKYPVNNIFTYTLYK